MLFLEGWPIQNKFSFLSSKNFLSNFIKSLLIELELEEGARVNGCCLGEDKLNRILTCQSFLDDHKRAHQGV